MSLFKTERLADGHIVQSGIPSGTSADRIEGRALLQPVQAVVLATYYADDASWTDYGWAADGKIRGVCCDVRTYGRTRRMLYRVPVLQRTHGLHDQDLYIPRSAHVNLTQSPIVSDPSPTGERLTPAEDLDGDHVLIAFLEGDPSRPVILPYCLSHPATTRRLTEQDGRIRRIRHNGTRIEFDKEGNLTIDATEAAEPGLTATGGETHSPARITIKTKSSSGKLTSISLTNDGKIFLGSDPTKTPTSPIVCGTEWISIMAELIDAIKLITVGTSTGPSTTPINSAIFDLIKQKIEAKSQVSDFVFTQKSLD
jgi:hypothetical protein